MGGACVSKVQADSSPGQRTIIQNKIAESKVAPDESKANEANTAETAATTSTATAAEAVAKAPKPPKVGGVRFADSPVEEIKGQRGDPTEDVDGDGPSDGDGLGMLRSSSFHAAKVMKEVIERRTSQHLFQNLVVENIERDIQDYYDIDTSDILGSGLSGIVVKAVHKQSGIEYAVKTLHKKSIKLDEYVQVKEEIRVMQELDHPNILRIHEYFEDRDFIFLVSELCKGGELLTRLNQQKGMHYSERTACAYVHQMVSAIRYIHAHNIVHRDLKLENFLFVSDLDDSYLKLIDFGLSRHLHSGEEMHQSVGTAYYIAPEVLDGNYDARCDVWSLGVITYMLLSGKPPFDGNSSKAIMDSIRRRHWNFSPDFNNISRRAKSFISSCLSNISNRPTAEEAAQHSWFNMLHPNGSNTEIADEAVNEDIIERLKEFGNRNTLSKLCMEVVAHSMLPEQIKELKKEFQALDVDNSGALSYQNLRKAVQTATKLSDEELEKLFNGVNFDHSGEINYHEFIAATLSRSQLKEENIKMAFFKISNNTEFFTGEDLTRLAGVDTSPEGIKESLQLFNIQPTDLIDYDKFKTLINDPSYKTPKASMIKKKFNFDDESISTKASLAAARQRLEQQPPAFSPASSTGQLPTVDTAVE